VAIERDSGIVFDPDGTLRATTSWISKHDEGLAELLKNVRYAYLPNRANVEQEHHVAAILLANGDESSPARIGVLDVGGATLDDLMRWKDWQCEGASLSEGTQGNGGKAYLYRMFSGEARLLGVKDGKRNCKGFEGAPGKERGTPGFMPTVAAGREAPIASLTAELDEALAPYSLAHTDLPKPLLSAIKRRAAFTLAEGVGARDVWRGRIQADDLIQSTLLHEQATLVIEQVQVYAIHNGKILNAGKSLQLEPIIPHPDFETLRPIEIPEQIPDQDGTPQSTTLDGKKPRGRLILGTSKDNMERNWKRLRPRWKVTYSTGTNQPIGSKSVGELLPTTPGSSYVYATVELPALWPDYVTVGRIRPNEGPLMRALDKFITERLRELANQISAKNRVELDEKELDAVHRENQKLDHWKNQFLPSNGHQGEGGVDGDGPGSKRQRDRTPTKWGTVAAAIDIEHANETLKVGRGVCFPADWFLQPHVIDSDGLPVRGTDLIWCSNNPRIADFPNPKQGRLVAKQKGQCAIQLKIKGKAIQSEPVQIAVWIVDHVLLTPRELKIPLGTRQSIIAEVTNDDGERSADVLLNWKHDADDSQIVRIAPSGTVAGNKLGRTAVSAGAGDPKEGGVWARVPAEIEVVENPNLDFRGGAFPTLKLTDKDIDPETGTQRPSDPDEAPLYQSVLDHAHNIWWLNLGSKEAEAAFNRRNENPQAWRLYHAQKVVEMVVHVHMKNEYTSRAEGEIPGLWSDHWSTFTRLQKQYIPMMWDKLNAYLLTGAGLE
jgi:hypothetical protein